MGDAIRANMPRLEHLPFEDGYFDYVRICNIALGVPEDEVSTPYFKMLYQSNITSSGQIFFR